MSDASRDETPPPFDAARILRMIADDAPLNDTLADLMLLVEAQEPGARCGIMIVGDDGAHFRRGGGPSLPEKYHAALDGASISPPYLGACWEAAHACTGIVVRDIANDPRYSGEWRGLVLSFGLRALRSTPVRASDGRVLASFAIYYDRPRDPTPADPRLIETATMLAALALERRGAPRRGAEGKDASWWTRPAAYTLV